MLTTEQIVSHMVDCIKEVNTVVQIPTTTVRSASIACPLNWVWNSPNLPKDHAFFFAASISMIERIHGGIPYTHDGIPTFVMEYIRDGIHP